MSRHPGMLSVCIWVLVSAAYFGGAAAADDPVLPIGLTADERERLDEIGSGHIRTSPPSGPIRNCAEWEPSEGVIIRWPLGIPYSLIAEMSEDVVVTTIVGSQDQKNQAIATYTANGVVMANTRFLIAPTNSIWVRDYGPWFVFNGGQMAIVDHIYNRPRPLDDQIPWIIGAEWGLTVYGMDLVHTGGNHMSDGLGRSMSTRLVYDENPGLSPAEVDSVMLAYVGNDYTVLEYIEWAGIHHIDCWAKFLDPATILVKEVSPGDASYDPLNARAEYLSGQISAWGRPYTIVRIFCPSGTAYTNSMILNRKVLVPLFNSDYDTTAIRVYEEAMPGYEVLGFLGGWYDDDAIHCRALGVPDRGMLAIRHVPLGMTGDTLNDYLVSATITAYSASALITDSLKIYYQAKSTFQAVPLTATAVADSFVGYIPAQKAGTKIAYYLQAADYSGRVETHPYIGPAWAHTFYVNHPPEIISPDSLVFPTGTVVSYCPEISDTDDSMVTIAYTGYPAWLAVQDDSLTGIAPDSGVVTAFTILASDPYSTTRRTITLQIYRCGDANGDNDTNIADAVFLVNYVFREGPPPQPVEAGDANEDGLANLGDAVYVINYVFKDGPAPCPHRGSAVTDDSL